MTIDSIEEIEGLLSRTLAIKAQGLETGPNHGGMEGLREKELAIDETDVFAARELDRAPGRSRLLLSAAAACTILAGGLFWALSDATGGEPQVVAAGDPTAAQSAPGIDGADDASHPNAEVEDETRVILASQTGLTGSRYLRIWNRQTTDEDQLVLLREQWFDPSGAAIGATTPIPSSGDSESWLDPVRTLRLDEMEVVRGTSPERDYGYPEAQLPSTVEEMAAALANDPELMPGIFMSISTLGPDSSYLPGEATTSVRNLTRLLPTIMDAAPRRLAFDAASALEGAVLSNGEDILSRPSRAVTVPLSVADPTTGFDLGQLDVKFWFDPDSYAVLQIEWRLTEGTLGESGISRFVDTTVIVAAGHVAAIPQVAPTTKLPDASTTTTPPIAEGD